MGERSVPGRMEIVLEDDLATVFAGGEGLDLAAVRVAETLLELADAVLLWAKTPGEHGGNPYGRNFVRMAQRVKGVR